MYCGCHNISFIPQRLEQYIEKHYSQLHTLGSEPITIAGDRVALEWPDNTGWEISPDKEPCEVWLPSMYGCSLYIMPFQLTKEMLEYQDSSPYPPMIRLSIRRSPTSDNVSAEIPVEIVGIVSETRKRFILQPKPRQSV